MGALILAPALAQAHPGHELSRAGLSHLMTSFDHLTVLSLVGGTLLVGSVLIQRRFPRLFLRGCGVLTLVATTVLWGVGA